MDHPGESNWIDVGVGGILRCSLGLRRTSLRTQVTRSLLWQGRRPELRRRGSFGKDPVRTAPDSAMKRHEDSLFEALHVVYFMRFIYYSCIHLCYLSIYSSLICLFVYLYLIVQTLDMIYLMIQRRQTPSRARARGS